MSKTKEYLESLIAEGKIPGCELVVKIGHETVLHHLLGTADTEKTRPMTTDLAYYVFSCTKPVTAAAAIRLWDEGKLDLDATVGTYLEEYRSVTANSKDGVIPVGDRLTVRNLLTMTGGLNYSFERWDVTELLKKKPNASTREIVRALSCRPLDFVPGERYQYSLCHDVMAAVIEEITGKTFGAYLKEAFFDPLGMTHTHFARHNETDPNLAPFYVIDEEDRVSPCAGNPYVPTDAYESGGAGLVTTTADYAAFAEALACGGVGANGCRVLSERAIREMTTEQLSKILPTHTAEFGGVPEIGYGYGLGVRTLIDKKDFIRSSIGEFGWGGAAGGYILMDPATQVSVVYLQHVLNHSGKLDNCIPLRDMIYDELSRMGFPV